MRSHIVEGEPGIFPWPVARVLQGIGGLFRRRPPVEAEPPAPAPADEDDPPPEPRSAP
ncbi:MAG TPA: hypothetical protein VFM27_19745 [Acidimicrobiales bacterium]|nr:hypothetical protein [Acidimicrobiales bacterium]